MPFPLAHPAAVLPLRRYCPRYFSFAALIVGSLVPDLSYLFAAEHVSSFAHTLVGALGFALPVGLLVIGAWYACRGLLLRLVPARWQGPARRVCQRPLGSIWVLALSLTIGAWTHIAWDSFTHKDAWLVQHVSWLQLPVATWDGRHIRLCHVLWYCSSFAGVAVLFLAYANWRDRARGKTSKGISKLRLQAALLVALLVLPIELAHHFVHDWQGDMLVSAGTLLLVAGIVWTTMRNKRLPTGN